ncbi:hypothetical protein [Facklamia hominis]|uniref:Uncharacterized protein n=1 Tax=Facklamia hominis TaxID=178214 RepID=A0AAJ1Q7I0_9LACT|nr:hypothetical protein [Facklamia hominis]MDK7188139.1 hypothetical protein [Facklamia hominis]
MRKLIYSNGKEIAKRYIGDKIVWRKKTLRKQTFYTKSTLSPNTTEIYTDYFYTEIPLRQRFEADDVKEVIFMERYKFTKDDFSKIRSGEMDNKYGVVIELKKSVSDMTGYKPFIIQGASIEVFYYG